MFRLARLSRPMAGSFLLTLLPALVGIGLSAPRAMAQNVGYSIGGSYEEIRWDDAFGLERTRLPSVRAAVDFGPYFSLQPYYSWTDGVGIHEDLTPSAGSDVADLFDVRLFGADLQVNLGGGPLVPFIRGGGGVLRTDDEVAGERDRIFLRYGAGLRFGLGERAGAEIFAENLGTRLASPFIPGAVAPDDFPDDGIVNSLVLGAGLRLPLGGGYRAVDGVQGLLPGIFLEPYAARIDFADELRLPRQHTAGVRAGIDFNQNVGLRAVAWRGVDDDFSEWEDVEGFGAEAQFALNSGPGISPFLVAGAGRVRFKEDFRDLDDEPRSRENHLTLGGGIGIGLGDRTRIELGARNLLMTVGDDLEDITSPDELISNWQYSAGLSVSFGAQPRTAAAAADQDRIRREAELDALREENRRLRAGEDPLRVPQAGAVAVDTVQGTRTMTIPVPEVGEVILRYGEAYAVRTPGVAGMTPAEITALEQRIEEVLITRGLVVAGDTTQARLQRELMEAQLPEIVREVVREEMERLGVQPGAPVPATQVGFLGDRQIAQWLPFTGTQFSSPTQLLLGARADIGLVSDLVPLHVLPEVSFGIGEGDPSLKVALNVAFEWGFGGERNLTPYGLAGVGLSSRRIMTADLAYGLKFDVPRQASSPTRLFVEHRGISWYREHQVLVGVSLAR